MSNHRRAPSLPETLGAPDTGFMAAVGAYVAAVFVVLVIAGSVSMGASAATVIGGVSTAITVGLIAGGVASGCIRGLPERLGRGWRSMALLFVIPGVFIAVALLTYSLPQLSNSIALGAMVGAGITALPAFVVASMSRTRYAKAMTPDDPLASTPLLNPNRARHWIAIGLLNLVLLGFLLVSDWALNQLPVGLTFFGLYALLYGVALRCESADPDTSGLLRQYLTGWIGDSTDHQWIPKLRVHENGIAVKHPAQRRFIPWTAIEDVRLTDEELVVERRRFSPIRCDRVAIENPERLRETIERARSA